MSRVPKNGAVLLRFWAPVVFWVALIGVESTDWLSAANTGEFLYWIVRQFAGPINRHPVQVVHDILRELGHFFGYGILGVLLFRALRATFVMLASVIRCAMLALVATLAVAASDEWHQSFIASRQGRVRDVILDMFGAIIVLSVFLLLERVRNSSGRQHWTIAE